MRAGGDYRRYRVYVDDCAEGIALIAEPGRICESYLLSAEHLSYRAIYDLWATTPGAKKQMSVMPKLLAVFSAMLAEPAQRWLRLPNLLSVEAARAAHTNHNYVGAKTMRELSWQPRDLRQARLAMLSEERRWASIVADHP